MNSVDITEGQWKNLGAIKRAIITIANDKVDYFIATSPDDKKAIYAYSRQIEIGYETAKNIYVKTARGNGRVIVEVEA